jgi:fucose 4-O-acetylase-like acetyltransferase
MAAPNTSTRNLALDNLRVVAMLLGLLLHGVLPFKATNICRYPIADRQQHILADVAYFAIHDFRMQLFFVLAGYAAASLAARKGVRELARNRLRRIVLPMLLAVLLAAPVMRALFVGHEVSRADGLSPEEFARQVWGGLDLVDWLGPNFHLWFLYFLTLCYVPLALAPALPGRLVRAADGAYRRLLGGWWRAPVLAAAVVPVLWGMTDWWIETQQGWIPDPVVYGYYLGFFAFGGMLARHRDLLAGYGRRWPALLTVANLVVLPGMLKLTVTGNWLEEEFGPRSPDWLPAWKAAAIFLGGLYTWLMVEGLVGLFQRHFAGRAGWWSYLSESSYWCYLAGFPVQVALQVLLAESALPLLVKFAVVNGLTVGVLLASYELCVRHTWVGLLLNGKVPERTPAVAPGVVITGRVTAARPRAGERVDKIEGCMVQYTPRPADLLGIENESYIRPSRLRHVATSQDERPADR